MTDAMRVLLDHFGDLIRSMEHQVALMRSGSLEVREDVGQGMTNITARTITETEARIGELKRIISAHDG